MSATAIETTAGRPSLLRRLLQVDAIVTGAAGILLAVAAGPLADLFDLPVNLLRVTGIALIPWTAFAGVVATRAVVSRRGAWIVAIGNLAWTIASLLLLVSGWVDPSALGVVFVVVQALLVAGFAAIQMRELRREE